MKLQVQIDTKTLESLDHIFSRAAGAQDSLRDHVTATMAAAIAGERERCAKIAEDDYYNDEGGGLIAAKIRSGE